MVPPSARSRAARAAVAVLGVGALTAGLGGCGRGGFEDRTAVVTLGGSQVTYEVVSCGLDDRTIFVVARAPDGAVVQLVMGMRADGATAVDRATGMTVDLVPSRTDTRLAAFGPLAWERREGPGEAPGRIGSARLRGSRIQVDGEAVPVDAQDRVVPGGDATPFSVDARCDERDD